MLAPWPLDTSHPEKRGLLASVDAKTLAPAPIFPRDGTERRTLYFLTPSARPNRQFDEILPSGISGVRVAFGLVDQDPTGGTFALSVNATTTGLTALAYDVSAATLEAAIDAIVPVTVVKVAAGFYRVTVVATNTAITWTADGANLEPVNSGCEVFETTAPAAGVRAVYSIRLRQGYWAFSDDWTARNTASDAVAITQLTAGSTSAQARYSIAISPNPRGGAFQFLWGEFQVVKVSINASNAADALLGDGFVLDLPGNETLGVYFTVSGLPASPPAFAAACTRTHAVAIATSDTAAQVAGKVQVSIDALSEYGATVSGAIVTITDAVVGARTGTTTVSDEAAIATTISVAGASIVATVDAFASATTFQAELDRQSDGTWSVAKTGIFTWILTRTTPVTCTAPTVSNSTLEWLVGFEGALSFAEQLLHEAFEATTASTLDGILEIKFTRTGEPEEVALHMEGTVTRDLLSNAGGLAGSFYRFRSGTAAVSTGVGSDSISVTFVPAFASAPSVVLAGPITKTSPSDDDPPLVMNVESITASGCTIKLTAEPTDTATLPYLAIA